MKFFYSLLITLCASSCIIVQKVDKTPKERITQQLTKISETEVLNAFDNLFEIVDNNVSNFGSIVTNDFEIFENSRRYNSEEFIEFVSGFDIVESKRTYNNIKIFTDYNSAHMTLDHHGEFKVNTAEGPVKMVFDWLESIYLVKQDGELKFKFYFSEAIKDTIIPLEN